MPCHSGTPREILPRSTPEVVAVADPSDFYDDGNQCTYDSCGPSGPNNAALADGVICPTTGAGVCFQGACVLCAEQIGAYCTGGRVCLGHLCVPAHCENSVKDPEETDYNCGGPCPRCPAGFACSTGADCTDGIGAMGTCQLPSCDDGVKNDAETGVDCGAPAACPLCGPGQGCRVGADCASGVCWAGACEAPSCQDGVRNGDEAGIDCGHACNAPCP